MAFNTPIISWLKKKFPGGMYPVGIDWDITESQTGV